MRTLYLVVFLIVLTCSQVYAGNPAPPSNLRTCDKVNPCGTNERPYFGWAFNDSDMGEIQTYYQIQVSSSDSWSNSKSTDKWDSGKVKSRQQNYVYYHGTSLPAAFRYYWRVRTWDKDGNVSGWSSTATFDTGLFTSSDWMGASWIKRNSEDQNVYSYFRKVIQLDSKTIKRAVVYISAFHSYELYINEIPIGKGIAFHYPRYAFYNAYDVTGCLKSQNTIAALTHWYGGGQGRPAAAPGFLMKLIVEYQDGSKAIFGTDETWKTTDVKAFNAKTRQRNGEGVGFIDVIDSRHTLPNWNRSGFDDSSWLNATETRGGVKEKFTYELKPDLTRLKEIKIKPVSVKAIGDHSYVIDLGKVYAGTPEIEFDGGRAGDTVAMQGGFVLNTDGSVSGKITQQTNLSYYFILNGGKGVFKPLVYLGYRYLQVNNSPIALTANNVAFISRYYELEPEKASFRSDNEMLNSVWELMTHSLTLGAQEGFVDTPTREKGIFLGDGWSQGVAAMATMGERAMNIRVLGQFLDSQEQFWPDGRLNAVYPNNDGKRDIPDFTQQFLIWSWDYFIHTGNLDFLRANYVKLRKIPEYVDQYKNPGTGLIHNLAGGSGGYLHGIIDWPAQMRYGYDMDTEARTVINMYAYADFDIISKIAGIIGEQSDARMFRTKALDLRNAINTRLINGEGLYVDGLMKNGSRSLHLSQQSNMLPLVLGIVPDSTRKTVAQFVKDKKMSVGMVTVRFLPQALAATEQGPHLLELYTNPLWDGWARTISSGGTATWESWDALEKNDSMCHPWGASGLLAMVESILGIKPITPGYELIEVKPLDFEGKLTEVSGRVPTDKGEIIMSWNQKGKQYSMALEIPPNMNANVYVLKGSSASDIIMVNGKRTRAISKGNYLSLENLGAGKYSISRNL